MHCPSSLVSLLLVSALSSSVHTSPWHRVRHRTSYAHVSPIYALVVFKWQPFWYFSLSCCSVHTDNQRDFISQKLMCLLFTFIPKKNNVTVNFFSEIYEHFLKIHLLFTSRSHLNFIYFDIWATKAKLCVLR